MFRHTPLFLLITVLLSSVYPNQSFSQSPDRSELLARIDLLHEQLRAREKLFLAPAVEDFGASREFLRQPDTGMTRLMPRERYDGKLLTRGGGAYYSFTRLSHEYGRGSDISLQQRALSSGFAGADFGFLTTLGDAPIETLTLDNEAARYLSDFVPPSEEPGAREQQRRSSTGFELNGFFYKGRLDATVGMSYALRSVVYGDSDVLVGFKVVRQDADGSLILQWRLLRRFPVPQLAPSSSSPSLIASLSLEVLTPQSPSREHLESEIQILFAELKEAEKQFLAPSVEDQAKFAQFLSQPDTGLIRLLPRKTYEQRLTVRGGGAYFSFVLLTHEYGHGSDIELDAAQFSVGFAGADFGFITRLGKIPIEDATRDHPGAQFLNSFTVPTTRAGADEQHRRGHSGFEVNGFNYRSTFPVKKKATYLLRSINYRDSDVLVAFKIVRQEPDGSVVLLWKILKRFPVPLLEASSQ